MTNNYSDYKLLPSAKSDLEDIWLYTVDKWSIEQAAIYITQITEAFDSLVAGSKIGRDANYIRTGYYSALIGSHIAYYKINNSTIEIVRILHQRMYVEKHLS